MVYGPGFFVEDRKSPIICGCVEYCRGVKKGWHIDIGHQFHCGFLACWVRGEVQTCAAKKADFIEDVMERNRLENTPKIQRW